MEITLYLTFFIIGTLFGSFFTLAVYRIPLGKNITHERSFCPKCNHKLGFFDLIPVLSYVFLGGKCKYCGEKIRPRYLILELASGLIFFVYAYSFNINWINGFDTRIITLVLGLFYFTALFIIAGIDREKREIQKSVLVYLLFINMIYMIYVCTFQNKNVYEYVIYLFMMCLVVIMDIYNIRKNLKTSYILQLIVLILNILIFSGYIVTYFTIIMSLFMVVLNCLYSYIKQKGNLIKQKEDKLDLHIGFYIVVSNIILIIINNFWIYRF